MPTKIINVLRSDKFEDIFEIFKNTPAKEVIFVLPNKCKSFKDEKSFAVLAGASEELDKAVLILSENPEINQLASTYNFGILTSSGHDGDDDEDPEDIEEADDQEVTEDSDEHEEHQDYALGSDDKDDDGSDDKDFSEKESLTAQKEDYSGDVMLAVALSKPDKSMSDILSPNSEQSVSLKINKKSEKPFKLDVRNESEESPEVPDLVVRGPLAEEIEDVWRSKKEAPKKKDLKKQAAPKIYDGPAPGFKLPGFPVGEIISKLSKKTLYLYGFGVIVIFGFVLYITMGKAEMIVKPRSHALDFNIKKVSAADSFSTVDPDLKRIPGQLFSVDKNIEETFPATGEKDVVQKARGKITLYNEYGTTPQVLIATTRFESDKGLIFRSLKTVTIPGTTVKNGKITPGSVDVEVIADKAGDTYNIGAGRFNIPAFKEKGDQDRYQKFYGLSTEAMKGGIIGKAKVVTEADLVSAKKKIEERIISEAEQDIKNQAAGLKILSQSSATIREIKVSAQVDEAVDTFTVSGSSGINTVGFKEEDLNDLITKYIVSIQNLEVFTDKLEIKFENVRYSDEGKTLEFDLTVKGKAYSKIDTEKVITDLIGQDEARIKEYFENVEDVSSAKVKLSPFWVFKVPSDRNKIEVRFEYD